MPTFYLDPEDGSDANNGTTFALRWKTITSGATAARIAPGDTIRIMASPDPTSLGINATWTNGQRYITLASALNMDIDTCESNWTSAVGVNCTPTLSSVLQKQGSNCQQLAIAAGMTTGLTAYYATGDKNLTGYTRVSFWIRQTAGTVAVAGDYKLSLCSDIAGATPVYDLPIPALRVLNYWYPVVVDLGGDMSTLIKSIAFYVLVDRGAVTLQIDNVIACKAAGDDGLTLQSLIGKNTAGETWYPIQSISGTTVYLDGHTSIRANTSMGYLGATETVTTYKREAVPTTIATTVNTAIESFQDNGASGSPITFSGGWNRTDMSTQTGETWWSGTNGSGYAINGNGKVFNTVENVHLFRYNYGWVSNSVSDNDLIFKNGSAIGCNFGTYVNLGKKIFFEGMNIYSNIDGLNGGGSGHGIVYLKDCAFCSNTAYGLYPMSMVRGLGTITLKNNFYYGIYLRTGGLIFDAIESSGNASGAIAEVTGLKSGVMYLRNANLADSIEFVFGSQSELRIYSERHDATAGLHKIATYGGYIQSHDGADRHTASGICWQLFPTSTDRTATAPLWVTIARIAVNAGALVTVKAWMKRSNSSLTGALVCRGGQIAGVVSDVISYVTVGANTYEELTITFTPTEAGVVEIEAWAYGGTTYKLSVDDLTISQA